MKYPTIEEVEQASHVQLGRWYRFLPSPNSAEAKIADRIAERLRSFGGMNASVSKAIGWQAPPS